MKQPLSLSPWPFRITNQCGCGVQTPSLPLQWTFIINSLTLIFSRYRTSKGRKCYIVYKILLKLKNCYVMSTMENNWQLQCELSPSFCHKSINNHLIMNYLNVCNQSSCVKTYTSALIFCYPVSTKEQHQLTMDYWTEITDNYNLIFKQKKILIR